MTKTEAKKNWLTGKTTQTTGGMRKVKINLGEAGEKRKFCDENRCSEPKENKE